MSGLRCTALLVFAMGLAGCTTMNGPMAITNPDFPLDEALAELEWRRMKADPAPPPRPIVILGGYRQPSWGLHFFANRIEELTGATSEQILYMAYPLSTDIEKIAGRVVREVDERWPSNGSGETVEVDVIGVSMGGIVARTAALGDGNGSKRLNIARLFTLATPHRGSRRAEMIAPDAAARALRSGSPLLCRLNEAYAACGYEIICYTQLNDHVVGATRAAPPGMHPIWMPGTTIFSHMMVLHNRLLTVDLARRLRGEEPFAKQGSLPPCD